MDYMKESLACHKEWKGKIEVVSRVPVDSKEALSLAYTPGVAKPCLEIEKDPDLSYELTRRHNLCAVITDGTAVLGLGDIGPEAGMPVMEGKCVLFKAFGDVDAVPLCIRSKEVDDIVKTDGHHHFSRTHQRLKDRRQEQGRRQNRHFRSRRSRHLHRQTPFVCRLSSHHDVRPQRRHL